MHSSAGDSEGPRLGGAEVLVAIAALVTQGRTPSSGAEALSTTAPAKRTGAGFTEGPHCTFSKASQGHVCNLENALCIKYDKIRSYVLSLWQKSLPLCIDVLLVPNCCYENDLVCNPCTTLESIGSALLLEQWHVNVLQKRGHDSSTNLNVLQVINAIRSQLYFSQISAWLASPDEAVRKNFKSKSIVYCLTMPGETYGSPSFASVSQQHTFPIVDVGSGIVLRVSLSNLPRSDEIPPLMCSKCDSGAISTQPCSMDPHISVLDDRMQTSCTLKGKHRCEDYDELDTCGKILCHCPSTSSNSSNSGRRSPFSNISNCSEHASGPASEIQSKPPKLQLNDSKKNIGYLGVEQSKVDLELSKKEFAEVLSVLRQSGRTSKKNDLVKPSKGDILLDAILRSSKGGQEEVFYAVGCSNGELDSDDSGGTESPTRLHCLERNKRKCGLKFRVLGAEECSKNGMLVGDTSCDMNDDSIISDNRRLGGNDNIYIDTNCDNVKRKKTDFIKMCDISNVFSLEYLEKRQKVKVKQKITFNETSLDEDQCNNSNKPPCSQILRDNSINLQDDLSPNKEFNSLPGSIPSALEQAKFRKSLDSAASMVFHSRTGLPLTSSPAPVRRGKSCFDFDSSINSVSAIRSALFSLASCSADEDSESDCSIVSPCSPDATNGLKQREISQINYRHRGQSSGLLGSFVESVLNGRMEPVSTVHGFSAELGASGSFCPRHVVLPVTVFFYTLGDNDKVSTPYLGHINLGKKGYNVPKSGTIQVTLFNPLGTVVKMFVIMYDLSDMPPNSQTFIRQRTLFMPANCEDKNLEWSQKWLRYLIHLRFMSSKSGRIYLHSDIRMIICRKSDLDTATAHGIDMSYELRSFVNSPTNPRFSPRK